MLDSRFIEQSNQVTADAGRLLAKLSKDPEYRKPMKKEDGSPVTKADIEVSEQLVTELSKLGVQVVSEESLPDQPPGDLDTYFLVDPVDGTKYFSRGEDEFAVCVGLIVSGVPEYGAIFDPSKDHLFWGAKGRGAFKDEAQIKHPGTPEKLRIYSSGFHKKPGRGWLMQALNIGEILEKGSALKFCDIAAGLVDIYVRFGPTSEWDTAAAQILLAESDCDLLDIKTGLPMSYGKPNYLNTGFLACHKSLSENMIQVIQKNYKK